MGGGFSEELARLLASAYQAAAAAAGAAYGPRGAQAGGVELWTAGSQHEVYLFMRARLLEPPRDAQVGRISSCPPTPLP